MEQKKASRGRWLSIIPRLAPRRCSLSSEREKFGMVGVTGIFPNVPFAGEWKRGGIMTFNTKITKKKKRKKPTQTITMIIVA